MPIQPHRRRSSPAGSLCADGSVPRDGRRRGAPGRWPFAIALLVVAGCGDSTPAEPEGKCGPVAFIGISGAPDSGRVFVGKTVALAAVAYAADHSALPSVSFTWTSSDSAKATVSDGVVAANSVGTVTITAACGDQRGTTELTIIEVPVAAVRVTPSMAVTYAGLKQHLVATTLDSLGAILSGRTITWASSNSSIATVDAAGEVTPYAPGSVSITATSGLKTGVAKLTVIARPSADWSAVTEEWVTYQGNATHTGYVPATADPVVFRLLWTSTLAEGVPLSPLAVGGGKVFASTVAYYGPQRLIAADGATGTPLWMYDFGEIANVNPPAYAAGSIYVQTGGIQDSYLWAFDAAGGAVRFRTPYTNQWSHYYAPVVDGQTVYAAGGYGSGVYAFSTADGTQRWFTELNFSDWHTPAVSNGLVYAYAGFNGPKLSVMDAATGVVAYEIPDPNFAPQGAAMYVAPALGANNDVLVTQQGRLLSFDLAGRRVGWELRGTFYWGVVTVANGVLYVVNDGQVEARRESDGALLWIWVAPEGKPRAPMIATRNLLFVSTAANTYAVDLGAHAHMWSFPAAGELALSRDGVLLVARADGKLTAIAVK